jgi:RHS repeat-associated protein
VVARQRYDAFGNIIAQTGTAPSNYGFSTKPMDQVTGLLYYGYRYYDPVTGRWPSRDPIEEQGGMNLYGFVRNNGLNWVDRFGLEKWELSKNDVSTDSGEDTDNTGLTELYLYVGIRKSVREDRKSATVEIGSSFYELDLFYDDRVGTTGEIKIEVNSENGELSVYQIAGDFKNSRSNPSMGVAISVNPQFSQDKKKVVLAITSEGQYDFTGVNGFGLSILGNGGSLNWQGNGKLTNVTLYAEFESLCVGKD